MGQYSPTRGTTPPKHTHAPLLPMSPEEIEQVLQAMEAQGWNMYGIRQDPPPEYTNREKEIGTKA